MWRFSGKSRIIVEFVATIFLSIAVHIMVNFVLKSSPNFTDKMNDFLDMEIQYKKTPHTSVNY